MKALLNIKTTIEISTFFIGTNNLPLNKKDSEIANDIVNVAELLKLQKRSCSISYRASL